MRVKPIATVVVAVGLSFGHSDKLAAAPPPGGEGAKTESADRDTTQKIRKALMADKTLSTYAHNVKILAHNGTVTLRGPVRSEEEKRVVAEKAVAIAGAGSVTNELTIDPGK